MASRGLSVLLAMIVWRCWAVMQSHISGAEMFRTPRFHQAAFFDNDDEARTYEREHTFLIRCAADCLIEWLRTGLSTRCRTLLSQATGRMLKTTFSWPITRLGRQAVDERGDSACCVCANDYRQLFSTQPIPPIFRVIWKRDNLLCLLLRVI